MIIGSLIACTINTIKRCYILPNCSIDYSSVVMTVYTALTYTNNLSKLLTLLLVSCKTTSMRSVLVCCCYKPIKQHHLQPAPPLHIYFSSSKPLALSYFVTLLCHISTLEK